MPIIYSLVAYGNTVLAEHATASGNFISVSRKILSKISAAASGKMSYAYDQHYFHYFTSNELIVLCMSDSSFPRRVAFAFLEDAYERFTQNYGTSFASAMPFQMNEDFSRVLARQMEYFSFDPRADKIGQVKDRLDDTKKIMVENIERILDRGEHIELLVSKTDKLSESSFRFKQSSRNLRYAMCMKYIWLWIVLIVIVLAIVVFGLWILSSLICGFDYHRCH